ncbi:MAG: NAD-dependent deacylase [Alphaproteobacteria bacterium]|nr:NAD-dependent deacylase [Alphaproteobacteria bacterium]
MKNIVILTGSGISAESGLKTFRSEDGLWLNYKVEDVCTVEAFEKNPAFVHSFYNELRPIMMKALPNMGHQAITMLQQELPEININVVTQNVDLLHEKADNKNIYHIHGRIDECICMNCGHVLKTLEDVKSDEICPRCKAMGMLKPNIVFFGEMPQYMDEVDNMLAECDMFIAIGTSGVVYPAAGFVRLAKFHGAKTYLFNLEPCNNSLAFDKEILGKASETFPKFAEQLINEIHKA